tara:strand:+ start:1352 stop:2080 length:729 start_codon:yes stop_codon:yes gene_type:complete
MIFLFYKENLMKNILKALCLSIVLMAFSTVPSKAFIMDVWELRGVTGEEVSEATIAFKEKAMAGGAKYTAFRSSTKVRGDDTLDTTFVHAYYDSYEDQMTTQVLVGQNPDWFASTFGELDFTDVDNITWANDLPVGEVAAGQTVAYAMVEITSGINFLLNFPEMQKKMQELGAPVQVASASCALCGAEVLPTNAMVYFSAANPVDMGKGLDIFASDEMQRWMFSNMAPHANFTDQGIVVFNN